MSASPIDAQIVESSRGTPAASDIGDALERMTRGGRVRRRVPNLGFLYVERRLPFLCVHRPLPDKADIGTPKLVSMLPCYFIADAQRTDQPKVVDAIRSVALSLGDHCRAVIVLELFSGESREESALAIDAPRFWLTAPPDPALDSTVAELRAALEQIELHGLAARVDVERSVPRGPLDLPVITFESAESAVLFTLQVEPVYRDRDGRSLYPSVLAELRQKLDAALRRGFFVFAKQFSAVPPAHPDTLGRRVLVKAARDVDQRLTSVSASLHYLLLVTPTNAERAWSDFQSSGFERAPRFEYRPLHVDPELLKRQLYDVHLERIEDPTLTVIFREKQDELDRLITMLRDRETERFVFGSLQVFGGAGDALHRLAREILDRTAQSQGEDNGSCEIVDAEQFAALAREEVAYYSAAWPDFAPEVCIRADVPSLMVVNGQLVIGSGIRLSLKRARALIQHEIGTHLLTYYNGSAQRLRHLSSGFAGYEALQEGLGVLAEYLAGGLTTTRLRVIASRVIAVRCLLDKATFVDTFRELRDGLGFGAHTAFGVSMRVYRSGGLTKDAIYLRGLGDVLGYLAEGGDLDHLFVGKIGIQHVPLMRELRLRRLVRQPRLRPRYLEDPVAQKRLALLRKGASVLDLLKE